MSASASILTEVQVETDRIWSALSDGGSPGPCGWVTDMFGLSWQIVPRRLMRMLAAPDAAAAARASAAMTSMGKIDIAALETAFGGE